MKKEYHILNGDALKQQFPGTISGEQIVVRECLVDGPVEGGDPDHFFGVRALFLSKTYGGTIQKYFDNVVPEFLKIQGINDSEINLWFEDDLFCQVNFWFVANLLNMVKANNRIFLVRPETHTQSGFGGLNETELISIYKNRIEITELAKFSELWDSYRENNIETMLKVAEEINHKYAFIVRAVDAHIDRIPKNGEPGRPTKSLVKIIQDLGTEEFGPVFREFCARESIYGFGDLQVKRLYDRIKKI